MRGRTWKKKKNNLQFRWRLPMSACSAMWHFFTFNHFIIKENTRYSLYKEVTEAKAVTQNTRKVQHPYHKGNEETTKAYKYKTANIIQGDS